MKQGGFTIVELLVVIIVVGILASVTAVTYSGIQDRARAATITENFKKIEDAFLLYAVGNNMTTWPEEGTFSLGANPGINNIANSTTFGKYLKPLDPVPGFPNSTYIYDNDGDLEGFDENCTSTTLDGINIRITNMNQKVAQALDTSIDDGNLTCGQVRWYPSGNMIKYTLSETHTIK